MSLQHESCIINNKLIRACPIQAHFLRLHLFIYHVNASVCCW